MHMLMYLPNMKIQTNMNDNNASNAFVAQKIRSLSATTNTDPV